MKLMVKKGMISWAVFSRLKMMIRVIMKNLCRYKVIRCKFSSYYHCWANIKTILTSVLIFSIIIVSNADAKGICATEQCEKAAKIHELPADVDAFVQMRDGCDYFRSEPWPEGDDPNSKDRRQFILQNLKETCTGTDKQLRELRNKYDNNQIVNDFLEGYEDRIEQK